MVKKTQRWPQLLESLCESDLPPACVCSRVHAPLDEERLALVPLADAVGGGRECGRNESGEGNRERSEKGGERERARGGGGQ